MGRTRYEPAFSRRQPWNDGRMVRARKPLKPKDVWSIRFVPEYEGRFRDRALFDLAIDSKLRGCDIVKVRIGDLVTGGQIRNRARAFNRRQGGRFTARYSSRLFSFADLARVAGRVRERFLRFRAASTLAATSAPARGHHVWALASRERYDLQLADGTWMDSRAAARLAVRMLETNKASVLR